MRHFKPLRRKTSTLQRWHLLDPN